MGAPAIEGFALGGIGVGGLRLQGLMMAGGLIRVERTGELHGVGVSAFNYIKGNQRGLTIGLVNFARSLNGVQVGLINIARSNPSGRKVLPIVNWGSSR